MEPALWTLAAEAKAAGLYSRTTYILDVKASLCNHMGLARELHRKGLL